jgi:histidinol-phosphate aminotransferase
MKINENIANIVPYNVEILQKTVKRFHANESQLPILPFDLLMKNVEYIPLNFYPEEISENLQKYASTFYKTQFIIPTNGSDEGLDLAIRSLCNAKDVAVVLKPTFGMYKQYCEIAGLKVFEFSLNENFVLDVDKLIEFCQSVNAKILFVPNPLAPSGGITNYENLLKIVKSLTQTFVVIDEAYIEFSRVESMVQLVETHKNLVVTRTLSKFFGLAGIRLGFIFASFKSEILKVKAPYNINAITAQIGINLFQNITQEIISQKCFLNQKKHIEITQWLKQFNEVEKIYESHANFLFFKVYGNSSEFAEKILQEYGMKIKDFSGIFSQFCRISL